MTTISALIIAGASQLQSTSPTPRLDAEILLGKILGFSRLVLIREANQVVSDEQLVRFNEYIERRTQYESVAYILGEKEFFGLNFFVSRAVLVPRPETELLVEEALRFALTVDSPLKILDLGTGSGCIAIALASVLKSKGRTFSVVAIDNSEAALEVAGKNAKQHQVDSLVEFRQSNWFSEIGEDEKFDIVLANPPYIALNDAEVSPELMHEPQAALYADDHGRAAVNQILNQVLERPIPPKLVLIEVGASQANDFAREVKERSTPGLSVLSQVHHDLAGLPRLVELRITPAT